MKKLLVTLIPAFCLLPAIAQKTANPGMKELMEKVIPWSNMMPPSGNAPTRATVVQGRQYSAYQIALIDSFTQWIKRSYIPVGGLPEPERIALPDSRDNSSYLPHGTGVAMGMWAPCYDASGKKIIKAQPASASRIVILTNHLKGLDPAHDYNTGSQYYFTMYYNTKGKLVQPEDAKRDEPIINQIKSQVGNYLVYPTGRLVNVLLMPENELPIVQVTKREVLEKGEEAVRRIYPNPAAYVRVEVEKNIKKLWTKHANTLDAPAFIYQSQLGINAFTGTYDIFEPMSNTRFMFPVYKFRQEAYELSKRDKPYWVHISFPYATEKSSTVDWEIFKAMTQNFNYQFVYDYFFAPEKTKGKTYQPLKAVSQANAVEIISARDNQANQDKTFPEGTHFREDFADARSGTMPAGWSSSQKNRGFVIEKVNNEEGKWLFLDSGSDLIATGMKKPMPDNFTLEFDLLCTDYANRTGRTVTLQLSGPKTTVRLVITPGNNQNIRIYPSMAILTVTGPSGTGRHEIEFSSYSNQQTKAHVKIVKSGTSFTAFINGTKVESDPKYQKDYEKEMALAANAEFNKLEWMSDTVSQNPPEDKGKVYISNIIIRKN